ncbi:NAD(P)/FAD-dependent oxidoreductase [Ferrimonas sp. SCSIO 43195]|uniref:NAD(P)/FAD-dependent oxidoreductase n=1 Tax=Ferrimonas sp. SCSIO 43195 TaxID=2822844 RepID=UPI0020754437|nr:NAD(P)/FAD-dependent oxidoreductase [Ferrimonas sp. SCSIO 43195]USD37553.1 NAD(P)/FAD-dependent oxidoreductase [Ferrimonas sp. SCSIO 43195]
MSVQTDVLVIGAGAAGLMCAATAAARGRRVMVIDHAKQAGKKILISGGGRCNFTNLYLEPANYLCGNRHFVKSALAQYTQWDFIDMVMRHGIAYHERDHGQLFCDDSAKEIVKMLLAECDNGGVQLRLRTEVESVSKLEQGFAVATSIGRIQCQSLVVATGGLSMPKLGASAYGYRLAEQFGLTVLPTRAGLVPFTLQPQDKQHFEPLSGISLTTTVAAQRGPAFTEQLLITHRGVSGPSVLQASNYRQPGEAVSVDLLPSVDVAEALAQARQAHPKRHLQTWLSEHFPARLAETLIAYHGWQNLPLGQLNKATLEAIPAQLNRWQLKPGGDEGYRTAEVTLGGVDTDQLSSKTMECKTVPGLFFVGEVMDVTGWLGGFNFQWAWSSGYVAGQNV